MAIFPRLSLAAAVVAMLLVLTAPVTATSVAAAVGDAASPASSMRAAELSDVSLHSTDLDGCEKENVEPAAAGYGPTTVAATGPRKLKLCWLCGAGKGPCPAGTSCIKNVHGNLACVSNTRRGLGGVCNNCYSCAANLVCRGGKCRLPPRKLCWSCGAGKGPCPAGTSCIKNVHGNLACVSNARSGLGGVCNNCYSCAAGLKCHGSKCRQKQWRRKLCWSCGAGKGPCEAGTSCIKNVHGNLACVANKLRGLGDACNHCYSCAAGLKCRGSKCCDY